MPSLVMRGKNGKDVNCQVKNILIETIVDRKRNLLLFYDIFVEVIEQKRLNKTTKKLGIKAIVIDSRICHMIGMCSSSS